MLPDVYILLSPQEEGSTHLEAHLSKKLRALSVIILVCLGNTLKKTSLQDKLLYCWSSKYRLLIVIDELGPFHQ